MIEGGIVDCMVLAGAALLQHHDSRLPWFLARDRTNHKFRNRTGEILFIDARKLGKMISRRNKELTSEDIAKIADTYHAWRGEAGVYEDVLGFSKPPPLMKSAPTVMCSCRGAMWVPKKLKTTVSRLK